MGREYEILEKGDAGVTAKKEIAELICEELESKGKKREMEEGGKKVEKKKTTLYDATNISLYT